MSAEPGRAGVCRVSRSLRSALPLAQVSAWRADPALRTSLAACRRTCTFSKSTPTHGHGAAPPCCTFGFADAGTVRVRVLSLCATAARRARRSPRTSKCSSWALGLAVRATRCGVRVVYVRGAHAPPVSAPVDCACSRT